MGETLTLSSWNRYKDTPVYAGTDQAEFGLFEPPSEFTTSQEDTRRHRVRNHEIGMLDKLAVRYYGPGHESLWWVIALANAMVDPEAEMYTGMILVIPSRTSVLAFTSRAPSG